MYLVEFFFNLPQLLKWATARARYAGALSCEFFPRFPWFTVSGSGPELAPGPGLE
jgi:hypothetical protein